MPLREFVDAAGTDWTVWEVQPEMIERRLSEGELQVDNERRGATARRAPVARDLRFGWLVFQSGDVKRRLAPIPGGWETADEELLRNLLQQAMQRGGPRIAESGQSPSA